MQKSILIVYLFFLPMICSAKKVPVSNTNTPSDSLVFILSLTEIRNISHFLTDPDITHWKELLIPKRKKAFVRYVKHLNERLEHYFFQSDPDLKEFNRSLLELFWVKSSFEDKILRNNTTKISFREKYKMWRETHRSKRTFIYKKEGLHQSKPENYFSQFFRVTYPDTIPLEKRFAHLAKRKKIKVRETMVVVFDKQGTDGSAPKAEAFALDYDNGWILKWGDEVHTDIAGSRIFSALGYDVDHPYYFGKNKVTVVFNEWSQLKNTDELINKVNEVYSVDLRPFISESGWITVEMAEKDPALKKFTGKHYLRFKKCSLEARPDRVKRIGSFKPDNYQHLPELREALLAHLFIGNWDTREQNTLLTTVHSGNYRYKLSAVFSDLGTSFGVDRNYLPVDFKTGLVNKFGWEVAVLKNGKVYLSDKINSILDPYADATYEDLYAMAKKISLLDENILRKIIKKAHWPGPIAELYFHKLASRRKSILDAFEIIDPHPIAFDKKITLTENGITVVKNGELMIDYDRENNPESFLETKGRMRNYGN